jgi:hypothetical protein
MSIGRSNASNQNSNQDSTQEALLLLDRESLVINHSNDNQHNVKAAQLAILPKSPPLTKEEIHNTNFYKALHKINLILAVSALLGEVTFGIYSRTYAAKGSITMTQAMGFNIDDLPTNYGDIATPDGFKPNAPALIEAIGWSSAWAEIVNGAFQFDVKSTAKESAEDIVAWAYKLKADGACASFTKSLCDTFSSGSTFLRSTYNITSLLLFAIATTALAYADVEQTKEPLEDWFGKTAGDIIIAWQGLGAVYYCIQAFLPRTKAGMEFIWDGPNFGARIKNHGNLLIELQYLLEILQAILVRAGSSSFLFGRLAEQWKLNTTFFYVLGALSGVAQGLQILAPGAHKKYHGLIDGVVTNAAGERKPVDPIKQDERDQANQRLYADMPTLQRFKTEFLRIFVIGVAQMGLGFYGLSKATHSYISEWLVSQGSSKEAADGMAYAAAAVASTLLYLPAYKASKYAELNRDAHAHRPTQSQPNSSLSATLNTIIDDSLNEIKGAASEEREASLIPDELNTILQNTFTEFDTANTHPDINELHTDALQTHDTESTPLSSETKRNDSELNPVVADRPAVKPDEEKVEPNLFAKVIGVTASMISSATRIPILVASLTNNPLIAKAISKEDLSVIGATVGATVGDNRYQVFTQNSIENIANLGCNDRCARRFKKNIRNSSCFARLFQSSRPKTAPNLGIELSSSSITPRHRST